MRRNPSTGRNVALAVAIARDGRHKYQIAGVAGIAPSTLADLVAGRVRLTPRYAGRLAVALGIDVTELLPDEVPA